ncbi:UNVERIFIED_ORG: hypothetical protein ABIB52_000725 [Arthrobacter sp. UYCu721]
MEQIIPPEQETFAVTLMWSKNEDPTQHIETWGPFDDEGEALDYSSEVMHQFEKYIAPEWAPPYSYGASVTTLCPGTGNEFPNPEDYLSEKEAARYRTKRRKVLDKLSARAANTAPSTLVQTI